MTNVEIEVDEFRNNTLIKKKQEFQLCNKCGEEVDDDGKTFNENCTEDTIHFCYDCYNEIVGPGFGDKFISWSTSIEVESKIDNLIGSAAAINISIFTISLLLISILPSNFINSVGIIYYILILSLLFISVISYYQSVRFCKIHMSLNER